MTVAVDRERDDVPLQDRDYAPFEAIRRLAADKKEATTKGRRWYLVHSYAQRIQRTIEHLRSVGYTVYYPSVRRMKAVAKRKLAPKQRAMGMKRPVLEPLFPQYLFLDLDLRCDPWRDVFRIDGISGMACAGDEPWPAPRGFIEGLKERERGGALPHSTLVSELLFLLGTRERITSLDRPASPNEAPPPFSVGDWVRINDGPFSGVPATVETMPTAAEIGDLDESARVRLLAEVLGRAVPIELDLGQIEKL